MIEKIFLKFLILLIKAYKLLISPLLPNSCRFHPSCSIYSKQSLLEHGVLKGIWLSFKRVVKCHPLCSGGYDPVIKKSAES
ncbi:MAG: membrane protein insertion efficiency factor YidD [Thermodesulfobacteriota bacterium]